MGNLLGKKKKEAASEPAKAKPVKETKAEAAPATTKPAKPAKETKAAAAEETAPTKPKKEKPAKTEKVEEPVAETKPKEEKGDRKTLEEATAETDALYKKYRAEVDAHAKARSKYYDEAKAAHDAGDGAKAKELSAKGKEEGRLMEEASLKAARAIFKGKNKDQPEDTIDLHGQHVNEAKLIVQEEIEAARKKKLAELKIIIGAGHHSDKDGPKVGPAVKKMLEEELNIKWRNDETNASGGCIIATL